MENQHQRRKTIVALAVNATMLLLHNYLTEIEESENFERWLGPLSEILQQCLRGKRLKPTRASAYLFRTIPNMMCNQFREHFRMTPEVYDALEIRLGLALRQQSTLGRPVIPVRTQLLVTLWLLATPDSFRSVGDGFDVGKSSASDSFFRVVKTLCNISRDVIKWPSDHLMLNCKRRFYAWKKMPNVIGAIDGTDIEIKAPEVDPQAYTNRKRRTSVILQAVCDSDRRFTNCFAGYPGSVGDFRVLRNSDLYRAVQQHPQHFFPNEEYIIGDKIYPVYTWLIPAFKDHGGLTAAQKNFNRAHAGTRHVIERAFALLKGRWRRLKYLDMSRVDMIPFVIIACCVLHNICLDQLTRYEEDDDFLCAGLPHVNIRGGHDNVDQNEHGNGLQNDADGIAKRNYLATIVPI